MKRASQSIAAVCVLAVFGAARLAAEGTVSIPQAKPAVQGNRAPYDLVFSPDGSRAYVTECAEGTIAVIDARTLTVQRRFSSGGERPVGLALTRDGSTLVVANSQSGSVAVLDAASGERRALVPLPGMPYGVALAPDGKRAYVTVSQLDQVAVVDLPSGAVAGRVAVGRRPRAIDITPDGKTLAVANLAGGSVTQVDTATLEADATVKLKGVNVRGIAVTADGAEAYTTLMPAFNNKLTSDPQEIWHNLVQAVTLEGASSGAGEDQWMDFARIQGRRDVVGSPDQYDIVLDRTATRAWIAVGGRDVVTRITIHDRRRDAVWPIHQVETVVGANPRGLAMTPDGSQVWACNYLGNSLSVVDTQTAALVRTIDLGPASRVDPAIRGEYLFNNAGMTRAHRFSCASCHPDGGSDGLTWNFVHVKDGLSKRNSRDLRAGVADTAPFRWSGFEKHLSDFVESEVTGLLGGAKPSPEDAKAFEAALAGLRLPPNPYRNGAGLSEPARAGQLLFEGKAGCASCHEGAKRGGTGRKAWVGTTPEGQGLDVPHLAGAFDSSPYLHDGRATSLEEVFDRWNSRQAHGKAHLLTPEERTLLLQFVREL